MKGLVVCPQPRAADVGAAILNQGGTAFDAAIATAFAQMIVDPFMCGIGGMGSIPGAIFGGLILGIAEIQADWFLGSEFRELTAYFLLFSFLIFRPGGLFVKINGAGAKTAARRT